MRACVLHQPKPIDQRPLDVTDVAMPKPAPGELRVRVTACGVCRTDLHIVEGELPMRKNPVIPGHQIVGTVDAAGEGVQGWAHGDRVGVAWLRSTCSSCQYCAAGRENLCERAGYTGWTADGGYSEYAVAPARFVYRLPEQFSDLSAAPLLCAGIIGYRCLRQCRIDHWPGARLGLYGFGAAAHIAIQIARHRQAETYVFTRDRSTHYRLAEELGACWVGQPDEMPPRKLDAAIVFAPDGGIVPAALRTLDKGGRLVLGGIHMSPIPQIEYDDLYGERSICTVTNNTRQDGEGFLEEAAVADVTTHVSTYPLEHANEALRELKYGAVRGAAVLTL